MVDFTMTDPVRELETWLLRELPELQPWVASARQEHGEPTSEYWLFSFAVKAHLEALARSGDDVKLGRAWSVLEQIASQGAASARNELFVTMEELDLWRHFRFMGPALREQWFTQITWYPERLDRDTPDNTHVNREAYRERWRQEICAIGGFENLSTERELLIRYQLKREFRINRLRAPKPGGREWRSSGLPWPILPSDTEGAV
jgi:hypothetical protein